MAKTSLTKALKSQPERIDISSAMTPAFYADKSIKPGKVLVFDKDGQKQSYRIIRLNRKSKKCEVIPVRLYTNDELESNGLDVTNGH